MTDPAHPPRTHDILRSVGTLACALLVYYGLPLRWGARETSRVGDVVGLAVFVVGVAGLIWLIQRQIRRYVASSRTTDGRVHGLLSVLYVVVVFFALFYYIVELNAPGQFDGLATRTDALYYTIVTLGTVGYGDVHAVGQVARAATTVQVAFDLVVIGALLAVATSSVAQRIERAASHG